MVCLKRKGELIETKYVPLQLCKTNCSKPFLLLRRYPNLLYESLHDLYHLYNTEIQNKIQIIFRDFE